MGSRTVNNEAARAWVKSQGKLASHGTYADAAAFGEVLFNCTSGRGSLSALEFPKRADLNNKILIDPAREAAKEAEKKASRKAPDTVVKPADIKTGN